MHAVKTILNTIILLGILQGCVLSCLLFLSGKTIRSNYLLAALILLMTLASFNIYLFSSGLYDQYKIFRILNAVAPLIIVMPIGPLIYFYVKSVLLKEFKINEKNKWHFYHGAIDLIHKPILWILLLGFTFHVISQETLAIWGNLLETYDTYLDIPRWFSLTLYLLFSKMFLRTQRESIPNINQANVIWLNIFLNAFLVFQFLWLLYLIPFILPQFRFEVLDAVGFYPIYIPVAILIYWLGLKGYLQSQKVLSAESTRKTVSNLSPGVVHQTITLLKKSMTQDKLYLDPNLTVIKVAEHNGTTPKIISAILNQSMDKSFNEFINSYRIEEVKTRLLNGSNEHLTISGIALESGFNSQATFQRAFKFETGMTPKEFLFANQKESRIMLKSGFE